VSKSLAQQSNGSECTATTAFGDAHPAMKPAIFLKIFASILGHKGFTYRFPFSSRLQ